MEKVKIWGQNVPGNKKLSKLAHMELSKNPNRILTFIRFSLSIYGEKYKDTKKIVDNFTYLQEIKKGFAKETYEDEPYIVPFLVEGSKKAVIVVPGGGFSYKSSDIPGEGNQTEGDMIAKALNREGISAFVLWYRSNPYHFPLPLLDMQRAIRFVRSHAGEYGIDKEQIGAVGFSAGGYLVAAALNLMKGKRKFPKGYVQDEIDSEDDHLNFAGLVYPVLSFRYNHGLLFAAYPARLVRDQRRRAQIIKASDCVLNHKENDIPFFFSYGTRDKAVSIPQIQEYMRLLKNEGKEVSLYVMHGAMHGYGADPQILKEHGDWLGAFVKWCKKVG